MAREAPFPEKDFVQLKVCIALKVKKTKPPLPAQRLCLGRQLGRDQDGRNLFVKLHGAFLQLPQNHMDIPWLTVGPYLAKQRMALSIHIDSRHNLLPVL